MPRVPVSGHGITQLAHKSQRERPKEASPPDSRRRRLPPGWQVPKEANSNYSECPILSKAKGGITKTRSPCPQPGYGEK
jgi:hypothetical protein